MYLYTNHQKYKIYTQTIVHNLIVGASIDGGHLVKRDGGRGRRRRRRKTKDKSMSRSCRGRGRFSTLFFYQRVKFKISTTTRK